MIAVACSVAIALVASSSAFGDAVSVDAVAGRTAPDVSSAAPAPQSEDSVTTLIERGDYAAATALLHAKLAANPADEDARFTLARVRGWAGDYAGALSEYDRLLAASPSNADYLLGRAQVLAWERRDQEALADLARARTLASDYEAVWQLEATVLARSPSGDTELERLRADAAQRFPGSTWWHAAESPSPATLTRTRVTGGRERSELSNGSPDWTRDFVEITQALDADVNLHATVTQEQRFGVSEVQLRAGADWRLPQRWSAGFEIGGSGDAEFGPRRAYSAWALRGLPNGWETEMRLRYFDYTSSNVLSTGASIGRYFGDFRAAYSLDLAQLDGGESAATHGASLTYYGLHNTQLGVTLYTGQDIEAVAPGSVMRTDVRGFGAQMRRSFLERWTASLWFGSNRQGDLYRRRDVGVSLSAGF
jgi:YaiO family outer membrane protein